MRDKIKFIEKLAESMNENKIESVKYEDNNFEVSLTKKRKERNVFRTKKDKKICKRKEY